MNKIKKVVSAIVAFIIVAKITGDRAVRDFILAVKEKVSIPLFKWSAKFRAMSKSQNALVRITGQAGFASVEALLGVALVASILFIVMANLWGSMQTANATIQANTATDSGTTTSKTMFGLLLWLIPLTIGIALVLMLFRKTNHD